MTTVGPGENGKLVFNPHDLEGKPMDVPIHYDYDAPVTALSSEFIKQYMSERFPDAQSYEIVGALWDHSKSTDTIYKEMPVGHFRIKVDGKIKNIVVGQYDQHDFLSAAARYIEQLNDAGIPIVRAIGDDRTGRYATKVPFSDRSLFVYEETPVIEKPEWMIETRIVGRQFDIGELVGKLTKASETIARENPESLFDISTMSDEVRYSPMKALWQDQDRDDIPQVTQDFFDSNQTRYPNIGNFTDKNPSHMITRGHDSAAVNMIPHLTENASFDCGLAIARIIMNPSLYLIKNDFHSINHGLRGFIDGYNKTSGKNLTFDEALQAGENALSILELFAGTLRQNKLVTDQALDDHVKVTRGKATESYQAVAKKITHPTSTYARTHYIGAYTPR